MLNEKIKELRVANGINQVVLAEKIGVSKQCVSNWESGYIQPSIDMLVRLARMFSVSTDYLLGLADKRFLNADGLTDTQVARIQSIIDDIRNK